LDFLSFSDTVDSSEYGSKVYGPGDVPLGLPVVAVGVLSLLGLLGKGILLMNSMYCEPGSYNLLLSHKV
jgi:hypothetical protein